MIKLNTQKTATILNATLEGADIEYKGVSIDTRTLQPGNLYIAINGENVDGHDYITQAAKAGAVAVLVSKKVKTDLPQILVSDTTLAMGQLAKYWREQFNIPFVGITGSCGKTTTTRMVAAILQTQGKTLYPEGNKNNQFGVPLTLFRLDPTYQFAVIEMGANRGGDIKYLASIAKPDVSILTNVAPVHIEVGEGIGFGSIEGVFNEKSEIFYALKEKGIAIVNADDAYFNQWQQLPGQKITFGLDNPADVYASDIKMHKNLQYSFVCHTPKGDIEIALSSLGRHNIINALAATAAGLALNISLNDIKKGLENVPTEQRRMIRHSLAHGAVLIDDSYNSNIKSAKAIIDMLCDYDGIKVAVLGDMKEIGAESKAFHAEVGDYAKAKGIDYLYTFGEDSIAMSQAFGDNAHHSNNVDDVVHSIQNLLKLQPLIVVKGSLSVGMDRIVNALIK